MKNPIPRFVLVLVSVAACVAAGYYVFTLEQRAAALRNAERAFTEDVLRLQATLADLRASQAGYLAIGQDAAVWIEKVARLRQQADVQLKRLTADTSRQEAEEASAPASIGDALAVFGRFDQRVADLLREEQTLIASAVIFGDSARAMSAASGALSTWRGARATKTGTALSGLRQQELYAIGGALALVLVVMLVLVPVGGVRPEAAAEGESSEASASDSTLFAPVPQPPPAHVGVGADLDLSLERRPGRVHDLDDDWAREERATEPAGWGEAPATAQDSTLTRLDQITRSAPAGSSAPAVAIADAASEQAAAEPAEDTAPRVDLAAAARLCTDLARVQDTRELQGLLARAASLLDASGVVVWMGGSGGNVLWPAFSHGYTPQTLSKMQALPRDGSTPVSAAFRSGLMEIVPAGSSSSGAIVAPILASAGCVGVMAVEIRHGAETSDAEQALAGIIAAQLATLVAGESQ